MKESIKAALKKARSEYASLFVTIDQNFGNEIAQAQAAFIRETWYLPTKPIRAYLQVTSPMNTVLVHAAASAVELVNEDAAGIMRDVSNAQQTQNTRLIEELKKEAP